MARKLVKKWNPKYNKVWVRTALQDVLSRHEPYGLSGGSRKMIKEVLAILDKRVLEQEEELKNV
jgi:hypothetical protein|tara:strand:- start:984 stop:1175 length:192 start_codon:yes stop_codon:yes gene_type:complete